MADEPLKQTGQKSASTLTADTPSVKERRAWRISWIWLVPFVAALVGGSLLVRDWLNTGPTLSITFNSAEGLEIDQTKVRYKDVQGPILRLISTAMRTRSREKSLSSPAWKSRRQSRMTAQERAMFCMRPIWVRWKLVPVFITGKYPLAA